MTSVGRLAMATMVVAGLARANTGSSTRTAITVWEAAPASTGGAGYAFAPSGGVVVDDRELDVPSSGELRIDGVAQTLDPASVQLRNLVDPQLLTITQQRFVPGASTPTEILSRHLGEAITAVTATETVTGTLRSVDDQTIVVEVGTGARHSLAMLRRDSVKDVRVVGGTADRPALVWHVATTKPGKQRVELVYRADQMAWVAGYLAIVDDASTVELSAWATVKNGSGASFDDVALTLASGGANPRRFTVPAHVHLGAGETVQVSLFPNKLVAKARTVVVYEAVADTSPSFQVFPNKECTQLTTAAISGHADVTLEVDVPTTTPLPDGHVRTFRRGKDRVDPISDDPIRSGSGIARIRLAAAGDLVGERRITCNVDEAARTIRDHVEVKLDNKGKQAVDVVVHEYMARWPVWRLEAEDIKGTKLAPQTQQYRVHLAAGAKQTIGYTVLYTW
jgi:hypothetical protein